MEKTVTTEFAYFYPGVTSNLHNFYNIDGINDKHKLVNAAEFAEVHKNWFKEYKNNYHQASIDLIEKDRSVPTEVLNNSIKSEFSSVKSWNNCRYGSILF